MKRTYFLLIVMCVAIISSCSKFLERPPQGKATEEESLKTEADLQYLLNGTYTDIAGFAGGKLQFISDVMGDQANGILYSGDDGEIYNRKTSIFGDYKNNFYTAAYAIIYKANRTLEKINIATTNKDNIEGQARFIRAYGHFEMVRLFAQPWGSSANNSHPGVPLKLNTNITASLRNTTKEVYDTIIADLQIAENKLPDAVTPGYPSKWAAKALLAKVYFQQNNFAQAFAYADQVIKSGKFQADNDYTKRFALPTTAAVASKEMIFMIPNVMTVLEVGGEYRGRYRSDVNFSPQSSFHVTNVFYSAATQSGDVRAAWYTKNAAGYNVLNKFNLDRFNLPIIHLTEILLIRAEAGAETGAAANITAALSDINTILMRAYGGTSLNLSATTPAATIIATTRTQRELEMIGEGNRLQEIKRIGARNSISVDRRGAPWNCNGLILQFPQAEKAANTSFQMNTEGGCN